MYKRRGVRGARLERTQISLSKEERELVQNVAVDIRRLHRYLISVDGHDRVVLLGLPDEVELAGLLGSSSPGTGAYGPQVAVPTRSRFTAGRGGNSFPG